jgi:aryl-alcohol dehydrogenase-like predicted oxidoreductase
MEYRRLGKTDLSASAIGFGCSRIAQTSSTHERRARVSTLERAVDCGINLFDTANSYVDDERLLGSVLRRHRERVILCSKAGYRSWLLLALDRWVRLPSETTRRPKPTHRTNSGGGVGRRSRLNFEPRFIAMAIEGSLRRLGTDYLDVFYLHSPPPEVLGVDAIFQDLDRLKQQGWIRHYGISFAEHSTTEHVLAALRHPGLSIVQVMVNPLESVDLDRIAPRAAELGVAIVGRQPFHRGALFSSERIAELPAGHRDRTAAQTVLRSVLQRRGVDVALVGMRSTAHLDENLGAMTGPPLSADEMSCLYSGTRLR